MTRMKWEEETAMIQVSLRECRMVIERLVQTTDIPETLVPFVRDCALFSAALQVSGFPGLKSQLQLLRNASPAPVTIIEDGVLGAAGQHAWLVADACVDYAVDRFRRCRSASMRILNVAEPAELQVIDALASRYGLRARVRPLSNDATEIELSAGPHDEPDGLDRIRREGLPVPVALWRQLYETSQSALAPDSVVSRRHAGPHLVEADGRIIGRPDEELNDFSMLTSLDDLAPQKKAISNAH
jgi:hypothetical protein